MNSLPLAANTYEVQGIAWDDSGALTPSIEDAGICDETHAWNCDDTGAMYEHDDAGDLFGDIGDAVKSVVAPVVQQVQKVIPKPLQALANQATNVVKSVADKAADIGKGVVKAGVELTKSAPFKFAQNFASLAANPLHAAATLGSYIPGISSIAKQVDQYTDPTKWAAMIARQIPGVQNFASQLDSIGQTVDASSIIQKTATSIANGAPLSQALLDGAREGLAVAKKASAGMAAYPGFGTGIAAAVGAADSLVNGAPLTDAVIAAAKNAIPGGPAAQAAFETGVRGVAAAAQGKAVDQAMLDGLRNNLPGGEAAKVAFDSAVALAQGKRVQDILAQEVSQQLLQRPELQSMGADQLASALNTNPTVAQKAIGALTGAAQQVGAPGTGAIGDLMNLPPLRAVNIPALRALGNSSLNAALSRFSRAAPPTQGPYKLGHHTPNHKTHLRQLPVFGRLSGAQRALVLRDAQGYGDAGDLKSGSSGTDVVTWQHELNQLGFKGANGAPLVEDGQFGANVDFATRAFQASKGLTVDGDVGPASLAAMSTALGALAGPGPAPGASNAPAGTTVTSAVVTTAGPVGDPLSDLKIHATSDVSSPSVGGATKNGVVTVLDWTSNATMANVQWAGDSKRPAATGWSAKAYLTPNAQAAPPAPPAPAPAAPGPSPAPAPAPIPHMWTASENAQAQTELVGWVASGGGAQYGAPTGSFVASNINGNWDQATMNACASFQTYAGVGQASPGMLDQATWDALQKWTAANVQPVAPAPAPPVTPSVVVVPAQQQNIRPPPPDVPAAPGPSPEPAPTPSPALPPGGQPMPTLPSGPAPSAPAAPPPPAPSSSGGGAGVLLLAAAAIAIIASK